MEFVARGVDAGAQVGVDAALEARQKRQEPIPVRRAANLNAVESRQDPKLIAECAQVFEGGFQLADDAVHPRERAADRLEVDVRSEEHTSELQSPCNLVC